MQTNFLEKGRKHFTGPKLAIGITKATTSNHRCVDQYIRLKMRIQSSFTTAHLLKPDRPQVAENIQPFLTLQLNIDKVKTIKEALETLVNKEQLEGLFS
ncbi:unnamed protein product [Phaedon cochleariae]|uniref:Uncharacterized protein n=1 Tax=Phaedon cochleariae TaxID=80249 RepID=A0A9N9SDL2_PHACE|nr:unnamed protein product [Phaedon cochleariae]